MQHSKYSHCACSFTLHATFSSLFTVHSRYTGGTYVMRAISAFYSYKLVMHAISMMTLMAFVGQQTHKNCRKTTNLGRVSPNLLWEIADNILYNRISEERGKQALWKSTWECCTGAGYTFGMARVVVTQEWRRFWRCFVVHRQTSWRRKRFWRTRSAACACTP
jgi:hypothetical protein